MASLGEKALRSEPSSSLSRSIGFDEKTQLPYLPGSWTLLTGPAAVQPVEGTRQAPFAGLRSANARATMTSRTTTPAPAPSAINRLRPPPVTAFFTSLREDGRCDGRDGVLPACEGRVAAEGVTPLGGTFGSSGLVIS